jgi:hypothetical protein
MLAVQYGPSSMTALSLAGGPDQIILLFVNSLKTRLSQITIDRYDLGNSL